METILSQVTTTTMPCRARTATTRFAAARARRLYRGPVSFRKESEPYMAIAIAEGGQGGLPRPAAVREGPGAPA